MIGALIQSNTFPFFVVFPSIYLDLTDFQQYIKMCLEKVILLGRVFVMKEDSRRVKMTKTLLHKGLIDALRDKTLDKITVTEICDFADVNRSTYYTYFSDPYDQLIQYEKSIGEDIREQLMDVLKDKTDKQEKCFCLFRTAMKYLYDIRDDFNVLVSGKIDLSILKDILSDFWEPVFPMVSGNLEDLSITERYRFLYAASGCFMMISNWFTDNTTGLSVDDLSNMLAKFSLNCYNIPYKE